MSQDKPLNYRINVTKEQFCLIINGLAWIVDQSIDENHCLAAEELTEKLEKQVEQQKPRTHENAQ